MLHPINKKIWYKDYDGAIIEGTIVSIGFHNKDDSIVWYNVNFGHKQFLVHKNEIIDTQLSLF